MDENIAPVAARASMSWRVQSQISASKPGLGDPPDPFGDGQVEEDHLSADGQSHRRLLSCRATSV
jgi:hypothetical protein